MPTKRPPELKRPPPPPAPPHKIKAKFYGRCTKCGSVVVVGQEILWAQGNGACCFPECQDGMNFDDMDPIEEWGDQ